MAAFFDAGKATQRTLMRSNYRGTSAACLRCRRCDERRRVMTDMAVQTDLTFNDLKDFTDQDLQGGSLSRTIFVKNVTKDDTSCKFYTEPSPLSLRSSCNTMEKQDRLTLRESSEHFEGGSTPNSLRSSHNTMGKHIFTHRENTEYFEQGSVSELHVHNPKGPSTAPESHVTEEDLMYKPCKSGSANEWDVTPQECSFEIEDDDGTKVLASPVAAKKTKSS
uniref:Uncharacterized protein n=1 Tax=Magallana gigas TaxID=29159 RepID=K1QBZ3_MAGGI